MRLLKKKIARAHQVLLQSHESEASHSTTTTSTPDKSSPPGSERVAPKRKRVPGCVMTPEKIRITKNIVINYGKAISSFAVTSLAYPYLQVLLEGENAKIERFHNYVKDFKAKIGGISSFRQILIYDDDDTEEIRDFKRAFKSLAETFIKHYCFDWINNGRMSFKEVYLKYRLKLLKKIQEPESFTYLKDGKHLSLEMEEDFVSFQ